MDATLGLDELRRIGPKWAVPVHHVDYRVFCSPLSDYVEAVSGIAPARVAGPVRRGDQISL